MQDVVSPPFGTLSENATIPAAASKRGKKGTFIDTQSLINASVSFN
jgi:hypothetical protein